MSALETVPSVHSSQAEVWYLKDVTFSLPGQEKKQYKVITQNFNGPCSFIAICNILILRGDIQILPPGRTTVSYEFLSQLVAEYLLLRSPDVDISAALSIMPYTQSKVLIHFFLNSDDLTVSLAEGMDLNPCFNSADSFRPSGPGSGGLQLFQQAGIQLVHGWLVGPDDADADVVSRVKDYDAAVELIVEIDHLTNGRLVVDESVLNGDAAGSSDQGASSMGPSPTTYTDAQRRKIEDAITVRRFLETTSHQLTYHGLFHLAQTLNPHTLYALFRNSHLSVLYKTDGEDPALYTLVTDQVFLYEPSVVWERLEDIDGSSSTFVDSDFVRAAPAGGDFAGQSAEDALRAAQIAAGADSNDEELARQLQEEEQQRALREHEQYMREQQARTERENALRQLAAEKKHKKKKSECVIM